MEFPPFQWSYHRWASLADDWEKITFESLKQRKKIQLKQNLASFRKNIEELEKKTIWEDLIFEYNDKLINNEPTINLDGIKMTRNLDGIKIHFINPIHE